ncbi:hypothetical protein XENORESO_016648 [Xenotaenia resolanae]|uniref:Uncharacterized protein n=1 Tax=Xenotaenia resolanae TaxID=208358 RepID=A0ABV0WTE3_9TELE
MVELTVPLEKHIEPINNALTSWVESIHMPSGGWERKDPRQTSLPWLLHLNGGKTLMKGGPWLMTLQPAQCSIGDEAGRNAKQASPPVLTVYLMYCLLVLELIFLVVCLQWLFSAKCPVTTYIFF